MTEELTAEEREHFRMTGGMPTQRLLSLCEAALARAEAAEGIALLHEHGVTVRDWLHACSKVGDERTLREAAESALAEATALLRVIRSRLTASHPEIASDIDWLLSRTPAPAAPVLCHDKSRHKCSFQPAPAAESDPDLGLTRWAPCEVDAEDEDGPVFQGFPTDPAGKWVQWEDASLKLRACSESRLAIIGALDEKKARIADLERELAAVREDLSRIGAVVSEDAALASRTMASNMQLLEHSRALRAAIDAAADALTDPLRQSVGQRIARALAPLRAAQKEGT